MNSDSDGEVVNEHGVNVEGDTDEETDYRDKLS
jgi:hypothetical protein